MEEVSCFPSQKALSVKTVWSLFVFVFLSLRLTEAFLPEASVWGVVWPWFLEEMGRRGRLPGQEDRWQDRGAPLGLACVSSPSQALSTLPLVTSGGRDLLDAFESTGLEGSRRLWSESQALSLRFSLWVSSP